MFHKLALLFAVVTTAAVVDQGAPGRQGSWPVYIVTLPDGGGGMAQLWADAGDGDITPSPGAYLLLPDGIDRNVSVSSGDSSHIIQLLTADGGGNGATVRALANSGNDQITLISGDNTVVGVNNHPMLLSSFSGNQSGLWWDGTGWNFGSTLQTPTIDYPVRMTSAYTSGTLTSDGGVCFHDGTCQVSASLGDAFWADGGRSGKVVLNTSGDGGQVGINSPPMDGISPLQIESEQIDANKFTVEFDNLTHFLYLNGAGNDWTWHTDTGVLIQWEPGGVSSPVFIMSGTAVQVQGVPLQMNSQKITGLAPGTANLDAVNMQQLPQAGKQALTAGAATVTFASSFASAPACNCTDESSVLAVKCASTTTRVVITVTGGTTDTVDWICAATTQ